MLLDAYDFEIARWESGNRNGKGNPDARPVAGVTVRDAADASTAEPAGRTGG